MRREKENIPGRRALLYLSMLSCWKARSSREKGLRQSYKSIFISMSCFRIVNESTQKVATISRSIFTPPYPFPLAQTLTFAEGGTGPVIWRWITHLDSISPDELLDGGKQACLILLHSGASPGRGSGLHLTVFPLGLGWAWGWGWTAGAGFGTRFSAGLLRSFPHSQPHHPTRYMEDWCGSTASRQGNIYYNYNKENTGNQWGDM